MRSNSRNILLTTLALGGLAIPTALAQVGGPCQQDDLAFGLSNFDPALTAEVVRGGLRQDSWTQVPYLQGMEFDNLGGSSHNARGNLLATNFGTTLGGGSIWSVSTNGTDAASLIYAFDGTNETLTRIGGLSVSPDNTMLAQIGYDSGSLILLDYTAGDGSGNGSAALLHEETLFGGTGQTQGTAWLNDTTVIAFLPGFIAGNADLVSFDTTNNTWATLASISGLAGGSAFTDIDYNTIVSPFVYGTYSSFNGATNNTLAIFDPNNGFALVNQIALNTSANTSREIALGFDNGVPSLFISQFGSIIDVLDISNPAGLLDDSSVDFYTAATFSAFNGLDYALTSTGGPTDCLTLEVQNLVAGARASFTVTNGTPGVKAITVYGMTPGSTIINNVAGYCANFGINGVRQNRVLGGLNKTFDASGTISFTVPIPSNAGGTSVLFQSAMHGTCPNECISNLVQQIVQ